MLVGVVKFHKSRKFPPVSKTFIYDIGKDKLEPLFSGSAPAPSPDGKKFIFGKRSVNDKADIYQYDTETMKETPLIVDTFHKFAASWSPDGKKVVYNRESNGRGRNATLDIFVYDMNAKESKQITNSGRYKSYNPVWSPDGNKIVYYFEKGDNHDQVYLTDVSGSFHTNLTNDTSTHNFYPSWIDTGTIVYTNAPDNIMTMNIDGSNKQKVAGVQSFFVKYDPHTKQAAYITRQPGSKLMLYDWNKKTIRVLIEEAMLADLL